MSAPRVRIVPDGVVDLDDAEDAIDLSTAYGLTPDAWQEDVLRDWLARRDDGKWVSRRAGISCPRQNGKNGLLEIRSLFGLVVLGERILHTAHEVKTARKAFLRLCEFFNDRVNPDLAGLLKPAGIRRANGQEAIFLANGGQIEFVARTKGSGRGYTVDCVILDEAQDLTEEQLAALMYTTSSGPLGNSQRLMAGTPPSELDAGAPFSRMRVNALDGKSDGLSWHEWSAAPGDDPDDEDVWHATNPALGKRIDIAAIRDERHDGSDAEFMRERLGMWDVVTAARVISVDAWLDCRDVNTQANDDRMAFALDMNPERTKCTVSVASLRADDLVHVEVLRSVELDRRTGIDELVDFVVGLEEKWKPRAIVIDDYSPAMAFAPRLEERGVEITRSFTKDMVQACGMFMDTVLSGGLRHPGQPGLDEALQVARKRSIGTSGGWAWHRLSNDCDITPLVSITLALWGVLAAPVKERPVTGTGKALIL